MSLTLEMEQKLRAVLLIDLFEEYDDDWLGYATKVYRFIQENYPKGSAVRMDDVAVSLLPFVSVDKRFTDHISRNKLREKHWKRDFCDLIVLLLVLHAAIERPGADRYGGFQPSGGESANSGQNCKTPGG